MLIEHNWKKYLAKDITGESRLLCSIDFWIQNWWLEEVQEQEEKCNHISDWQVYTSNPPQYKCKKCGMFSTEYMPMEEKQEEGNTSFDMHQEIPDFVYEEKFFDEMLWQYNTRYKWIDIIGKQVEILTKKFKELTK